MCPKYPTTPLQSNHFVFPQDRDLFLQYSDNILKGYNPSIWILAIYQ